MSTGAEQRGKVTGQMIQVRQECYNLRVENAFLRPLKNEAAKLRAQMADLFFSNSEKVIDANFHRE